MQSLLLFFSFFYFLLAVATQHLQPFQSQRRFAAHSHPHAQPQDPLDPFSELELLDIVLVASVDGKFHALNRTSGHVLWSMSSFPDADDPDATNYANSSVPKTLGPLVRTVHPEVGVDDGDKDEDEELSSPAPAPSHEVFIIEPQSGDIYVLKPSQSVGDGQAPLQRFPFSVPELVDMSAFRLPDPEAGYTRIFVGKKETSLLLVELETGKVKATVGADVGWEGWEDELEMKHKEDGKDNTGFEAPVDLDELEAEYAYHFDEDDEEPLTPKPKPTEVYIGRTDYHISIHTRPLPPSSPSSSPPRSLPPTQHLSFSAYGPPTQDLLLQAAYTRPKDGAYVQSLPGGEVVSFRAWQSKKANGDNGSQDNPIDWAQDFESPIVATFDVLRRSSPSSSPDSQSRQHSTQPHDNSVHSHTFVLLQPQPSLHDFHPSLSQRKADTETTSGAASASGDTGAGASANANANSGAKSDNDNGQAKDQKPNSNNLLPNADAAYVGMVEETGSLFAMSPGRFPFVAFGGYDSSGSNGSNRRGGKGRKNRWRGQGMKMIDAGPGKKGQGKGDSDDDVEDGLLSVDEITRRRNEREERERLKLEREKEKQEPKPENPRESSPAAPLRQGSEKTSSHTNSNTDANADVCPRPKVFECLVGMWKLEESPGTDGSGIGFGSGYPAYPGYPRYPYSHPYSGSPPGAGYPGAIGGNRNAYPYSGLPYPTAPGQEYRYYGDHDPTRHVNDPVGLIDGPPSEVERLISSSQSSSSSSSMSRNRILDGVDRDGRNEYSHGSEGHSSFSWGEETALAAVVFCVLGLSGVWFWVGKLRSRGLGGISIGNVSFDNASETRKAFISEVEVSENKQDAKKEIRATPTSEQESSQQDSQSFPNSSPSPSLEPPASTSTSSPTSTSLSPKLASTPRRRRQQRPRTPSSGSAALSTDADVEALDTDAAQQTDSEPVNANKLESEVENDGDGDGEVDGEGDVDGPIDAEGGGEKKKRVRRGGRGKRNKKDKQNQQQQQPGMVAAVVPPTPTAPARTAPGMTGGIPGGRGVIVVAAPATAVGSAVEQQSSLLVSDTVLGFGSHGTVVYAGSLQGRAVAVKRLLSSFVTLAAREVSILQESDDHPNVVRYYYQETKPGGEFMYIALELCLGTLAEVVEGSSAWTPGMALNLNLDNGNGALQGGASTLGPSVPDGKADLINIRESVMRDPKKALAQITRGLRHLHALKLVHRDIKPQNILVAKAVGKPPSKSKPNGINGSGSGGGYRMLISDFGLCKKLDVDQTSFLPTAQGAMAAGTVGWRAPEILRGEVRFDFDEIDPNNPNDASRGSTSTVTGGSVGSTVSGGSSSGKGKLTRLTKSVDIFALGCLFYYVLTGGSHPFGDRFEREVNILKGAKCLDGLERGWEGGFGSGGGGDGSDGAAEEGMEAAHLIRGMLEMESANRPDTDKILVHPFFWDAGKRLNFLQDASDRFEIMPRGELAGSTSKSASSSRISLSSSKSFNGPSPYEGERDPHLIRLEQGASDIVGMDWPSRCDKVFIDNLGKFRKYDGKSVQDLLRALRNKKHHYQDLPENVKRHLGSMPEGYLSYFTRRYPKLFLHVHQVVDSSELSKEDVFRSYFDSVE